MASRWEKITLPLHLKKLLAHHYINSLHGTEYSECQSRSYISASVKIYGHAHTKARFSPSTEAHIQIFLLATLANFIPIYYILPTTVHTMQ